MNELIFLGYILFVSIASLIALRLGKEALTALICIEAVLANIFVMKQISLFNLVATASDALSVGAMLSLNLLQEYYDKASAQKAIWISFFCSLFTTIITLFHLAYIPAATDVSSHLFDALLSPLPRIAIASLSVYLAVQYLDTALYGYLKNLFHKRFFIIRNYSSLMISQLIDTILFTFLGLYGLEGFTNLETLVTIMFVSYIMKIIIILISVPFVRAARLFYEEAV